MSTAPSQSRVYVIAARGAAKAVVFRRRPSKLWHVMLWDTERDEIEHGSWYYGSLYAAGADLSPDGRWLLCSGINSAVSGWAGVSRAPSLWPVAHWPQMCSMGGAGVWVSDDVLGLNTFGEPDGWPSEARWSRRYAQEGALLREKVRAVSAWGVERMRLEGFAFEEGALLRRANSEGMCDGEPKHVLANVWRKASASGRTTLEDRIVRHERHQESVARFLILERPELLDERVTSATWDVNGRLLVGRAGRIEAWTEEDMARGSAGFVMGMDGIEPPQGEDGRSEVRAGAWGSERKNRYTWRRGMQRPPGLPPALIEEKRRKRKGMESPARRAEEWM